MQRALIIILALLFLGVFNFNVYQKERFLVNSVTLFLELAPVDPRSLMQGDYMQLGYKVARDAEAQAEKTGLTSGFLIVKRDKRQIGRLVKVGSNIASLPAEHYGLPFHKNAGQIHLQSEGFFFQEGQAEEYQKARYGELRVAPDGESSLVGLRDGQLKRLGPPEVSNAKQNP
jgi:uncharacterized membrane-anchored protein